MKEVTAPLCQRCMLLIRDSTLPVRQVCETGIERRECVWCERNSADGFFKIQLGKK